MTLSYEYKSSKIYQSKKFPKLCLYHLEVIKYTLNGSYDNSNLLLIKSKSKISDQIW